MPLGIGAESSALEREGNYDRMTEKWSGPVCKYVPADSEANTDVDRLRSS